MSKIRPEQGEFREGLNSQEMMVDQNCGGQNPVSKVILKMSSKHGKGKSKIKAKKRYCESDEDHEHVGLYHGGSISPLTYELENDRLLSA